MPQIENVTQIIVRTPGGGRPNGLTMQERQAITREYKPRYQKATKKSKQILLDEFVRLTGFAQVFGYIRVVLTRRTQPLFPRRPGGNPRRPESGVYAQHAGTAGPGDTQRARFAAVKNERVERAIPFPVNGNVQAVILFFNLFRQTVKIP